MSQVQILHISDLHFGAVDDVGDDGEKVSRSTHFFVSDDGSADPTQLLNLLNGESVSQGEPDLVVASGDIGWSGQVDDYKPAAAFFQGMREAWPNTQFVITPGNHDVDQSLPDADGASRQDAFVGFLRNFYGPEFGTVYPLFTDASERDALVGVHPLNSVGSAAGENPQGVVISVNSAAGLHKKGTPVRVDPGILKRLDGHLLGLELPSDGLRVFVLHHHLLPFAEPSWKPTGNTTRASESGADPDLLANSAKIQGWLAQRRFHLVLHGHKHTSHGREDLLWRKNDMAGRRLLVVGAGSAGVEHGHRAHGEALTFNWITATRFSKRRWQVRVDVRQICNDLAVAEVRPSYSYTSIAGAQREDEQEQPCYRAERMDDCHRAIASRMSKGGVVRNFVSIVEDATYRHPGTAELRGRRATESEVELCFHKLHPEYKPTDRWQNFTDIDRHLRSAQLLYQFEHGSRLFQSPDRRIRRSEDEVVRTSPLLRIVDDLKKNPNTSRAYVSLYRSERDVLSSGDQPLPGLMGIHFVPRGGKLDVSATFRKIELSFWWCVNTYELGELLRWMCGRTGMTVGTMSFYASLAEWKWDPEAPIEARLDKMRIAELIPLVLALDKDSLAGLLDEKRRLANENNLDPVGLEHLGEVLDGALSSDVPEASNLLQELRALVSDAHQAITQAVTAASYARDRHVREGTGSLEAAVALLRSTPATT